MWERLTASARKATTAARECAARHGETDVTPEHLLWGILNERNVGISTLQRAGVNTDLLRTHVEALWPPDVDAIPQLEPHDQPSAATSEVLKYACEDADKDTNKYVGTEHLLIGILRTSTPASGVLIDEGVTIESFRDHLWKLIRYDDDPEPEPVRYETSEARLAQFLEMMLDELARKRREGIRCLQIWITRTASESVDTTLPAYQQLEASLHAERAIVNRQEVFEALVTAITDDWTDVRGAAVTMLGWSDEPMARETIIQRLLEDPDEHVRQMSALALRPDHKSPQCADAFISALRDSCDSVVCCACGTLGKIGDPRAIEPLREVLALERSSWRMRFKACEALVRLDSVDARVIELLQALDKDPEADEHNARTKTRRHFHEEMKTKGYADLSEKPMWDDSTGTVLALARRKFDNM